MKRQIVNKALSPFGTTIFTEINAIAKTYNAVNLSQGAPDFDGPDYIKAKAAECIMRGPNQYIASEGIVELRRAIAHKMKRFYDVDVDTEKEITVTSGATEGLYATMMGILEPGDEVILLEPFYDTYPPVAALANANVRYVTLQGPQFELPEKELAAAFSPKTRAIVINNPQNPCGKVFTREELTYIGFLCEKYDAFAIGDEVYEHLVFDGKNHVTLMSIPELRERAFVISSTAKTFSMTGWKIGYVLASPELTKAVRMSHQFITFCGQSALQEAMAFAIDLPDTFYTELLDTYNRKRMFLFEGLKEAGLNVYLPEGAYYVMADIRSLGFEEDSTFCRMLPEKTGVAAIPASYFWKDRTMGKEYVRFCFCKTDETLEEGILRLKRFFK
ncbi:MAG: aminotransferase class I/II-fold pyridoxal phosphate-dependent enzyme [Deltaproteobacteria bacterium]|nr:aminotransferase class I/II-fold pyridoxal phosphate-dependent enzyme [Deltaproteobacteria bacterium]